MTISRRNFGKAALALGLATGLAPQSAFAAPKIRLRYGTAFPTDHPGVKRIQEAAEDIRQKSDGNIDVQVYPNSQLGSEADMFSQARSGALDFMSTSGVNQTLVPIGGINAVAFAFENYGKVWETMDGDLGTYVREAFGKVGFYVFPKMLDNGYRHVTSSIRPITKPEELDGFKIRVPGNPLWVTLFKTLGASPTPINFGELYAALQTRIVDGQENPMALIRSAKLYEVQKYLSLTGHIWDGHYIFANKRRWESLPEDARTIIGTAFATAAEREREDIRHFNEEATNEMTKSGLVINTVDTKPFRDILRANNFYAEWKNKFGEEVWSILEKHVGKL